MWRDLCTKVLILALFTVKKKKKIGHAFQLLINSIMVKKLWAFTYDETSQVFNKSIVYRELVSVWRCKPVRCKKYFNRMLSTI